MVAKSAKHSSLSGERLASVIASKGLRKDFVAMKAELHPTVLSQLLTGTRPMSRRSAGKLAGVLQVSEGYLLGMEELPEDAA